MTKKELINHAHSEVIQALKTDNQTIGPKLTYHYPESMKKAQKKYEKARREKGIYTRLQTAWITRESQAKVLKIAKGFSNWQSFIDDLIIVYEKRNKIKY